MVSYTKCRTMIHLCEELVVEIFSRLPTKSILRFRSVSKSLCARISSPEFIRLRTLRSPRKVMITSRRYSPGPNKLTYTLHSEARMSSNNPYAGIPAARFPFTDYKIFGSCNGLLCVYEYQNGGIHLWNPSIRRKVTVAHNIPFWLRVSFDRNDALLGFGFDPVIDDYKILRIRVLSKPTAFVYTMKTHTWREIASPTTPIKYLVECSQCLVDGALHWLVRSESLHYYLLTFHLSSEAFSTIELPEPSWKTFQVTTIKGSLAVISSDRPDHSWIWVRNTAAAAWSVAYKLNANPFKGAHTVLQIAPSEELLCCRLVNGILVYNLETQSGVVDLIDCSILVHLNLLVESLELLDIGTSCDQGSKWDLLLL